MVGWEDATCDAATFRSCSIEPADCSSLCEFSGLSHVVHLATDRSRFYSHSNV